MTMHDRPQIFPHDASAELQPDLTAHRPGAHLPTGHLPADRPTIEIDLSSLRANWARVRGSYTGARVGAVVKHDAYGLGLARIVPALSAVGCRDFWVADLTEAAAVRRLAPEARIFVLLGLASGGMADFAALDAIPVLLDRGQLEVARRTASGRPVPVAIHLDTGLSRMGLTLADVRALSVDAFAGLEVAAYVTHLGHFSTPDAPRNRWQWLRFRAWVRRLPHGPLSFCASAGVFGPPERHGDLARVGSALYGVETTPARRQPIVPVATFTAPIVTIHTVPAGAEVGYGGAYRTPVPLRAALVAAGYADGVPFAFRGPARVLVGGRPAPVIGTSAMGLISVDVTGLPPDLARPGARVTLFGPGLPVDLLATAAGVAPNTIHVAAARSVTRVYRDAPADMDDGESRAHHARTVAGPGGDI